MWFKEQNFKKEIMIVHLMLLSIYVHEGLIKSDLKKGVIYMNIHVYILEIIMDAGKSEI